MLHAIHFVTWFLSELWPLAAILIGFMVAFYVLDKSLDIGDDIL